MKLPLGRDQVLEMIGVVPTHAPYDAIASTLTKGAARVAHARSEQCSIQVEGAVVDRMRPMRGPVESMSDIILRLAAENG
jgi:hypothetical protein